VNFLAHFHLAWPDPGLVAGGLEGDYRKGLVSEDHGDSLASGVLLHRAIDAYTDSHPLVAGLRQQFPKGLRRYAGILIDLGFDHFLTLYWQQYSDIPLPLFAREIYQNLDCANDQLSPGAQRMATRLKDFDILNCYHDWAAVPASAERIGERFRRGNPLLGIEPQLTATMPAMEQAFLGFYPDLQQFAHDWRRQRNL
jgi:acyl carrier protein phosphodiesterase